MEPNISSMNHGSIFSRFFSYADPAPQSDVHDIAKEPFSTSKNHGDGLDSCGLMQQPILHCQDKVCDHGPATTSGISIGEYQRILDRLIGLCQVTDGSVSSPKSTHEVECDVERIEERMMEGLALSRSTDENTHEGREMDCDEDLIEERMVEAMLGLDQESLMGTECSDAYVEDILLPSKYIGNGANTIHHHGASVEDTVFMDDNGGPLSTLADSGSCQSCGLNTSTVLIRTRRKRGTEKDDAIPVPPETMHLVGDMRFVIRQYFLALLRTNRNQYKQVPWNKLSHVLLATRRRLLHWPKGFAYRDGLLVTELSMDECRRLKVVKIEDWSLEELTAYETGQLEIPLIVNEDGECLRAVKHVIDNIKFKAKLISELKPKSNSKKSKSKKSKSKPKEPKSKPKKSKSKTKSK